MDCPSSSPAVLREYEDIHPGVAEQLFNLHEKQANHRMEMERQTQATDREAQARGQWTSFILVLAALIMAGVVEVWGRHRELPGSWSGDPPDCWFAGCPHHSP